MSQLFVISTPIGNRKDITLRALETLFSVDVLLCEDTRKTKQLLDFYREQFISLPYSEWFPLKVTLQPRLISYFEHNEDKRVPDVLEYLKQGMNVGLVSNAGTPGISDPGYVIIEACKRLGFEVVPVPGVSAAVTALSVSGLSADKYTFLGFLPRKAGKQTKIFNTLLQMELGQTILFYESPFRIKKTLDIMQSVFGDIEVTIGRELTKMHEDICSLPISQWLESMKQPLKGELVVLFRLSK